MELNKIYNEDCMEGMKRIPDGSVDAVITSPPYNINKKYGSYRDNLEMNDYLIFLENVFREVYRIMKPQSNFMLNVGKYIDENGNAVPLQYILFPMLEKLGFKFRQDIVWFFSGGLSATKKLSGRYENIMWLYKDDYYFDLDSIRVKEWAAYDKRNNPNGKNPTDVWKFNRVAFGGNEKTEHICQFPLKMIDRLVKGFTPGDAVICDPFMGSGTTAIACINTDRNYIGFELDKIYYEKSLERIKNHTTQTDIFDVLEVD